MHLDKVRIMIEDKTTDILQRIVTNKNFREEILNAIEDIEFALTDILINLAKIRKEIKNVNR